MSAPDNPPAFPAVPDFDPALLAKFVERIDAKDWSIDECWNWIGHLTKSGYGVFAPTKKGQHRAHRFALRAYLGREPEGLVLHSCDNRACVNPLHLSEGSHQENMAQMAERRRAARGPRHPKAKLTMGKATAINVLHRSGDYSTRELAGMFAMHQSSIAAIIQGALWPDAYAAATRALSEEPSQTLRDRFAGQALTGFLANGSQRLINEACEEESEFLDMAPMERAALVNEQIAHGCYALADKMLAERAE